MKSEKTGAVIYYKHLKILEEAQLSDEQIGQILKTAIKYDETGECPQFSSPLSAFFSMIKYDLDANREKWESIKKERSRVGKMGGRPKEAKIPIGNDETKITNRFFDGNVSTSFHAIKDAAKENGFFIDNSTAQRFCDCGLDPEWLYGQHSFLEFAAERIQENYGDKPQGEQKALYISAVRTWDELRDEYPEWKAEKEKKALEKARDEAVEKASGNPPRQCECGGDFRNNSECFMCLSCGKIYQIDEKSVKWISSP